MKYHKEIFGVTAAAVFFVFAAWFWSLGAVASEDVPAIRVEARQPGVEIKRHGAADWARIDGGTELQEGDAVRTDAEGLAEIRWGDLGVTRLDAGSEMTVDDLPADLSDAAKTSIRLHLSTGRAWSRLLKLYGPEAVFEKRTDTVVATVRGTAFGMAQEASSTRLAVTEAVVEAWPSGGGASTWIKQGKGAEFDASGKTSGTRDIAEDDEWVNGNKRLDGEFDKAFRAELEQRFRKRLTDAPEWLVQASEDIHLKFADGPKRREAATAYAMRRISALASGRDIGCRDRDAACAAIDGVARLGDPGRILGAIRPALLIAPGRPKSDTPLSWLSNLKGALLESMGLPEAEYSKILGVWDRDPAAAASDEPHREYLLSLTSGIESGIAQRGGLDEAARAALGKGVEGLYAMLRDGMSPAVSAPPASSTDGTATSTAPIGGEPAPQPAVGGRPAPTAGQPTQPAPRPTPLTGPCAYSTLTLLAKPNSDIEVGSPVSLALFGTCQDGRVDDLTAKSTFNPAATGDGRVVGSIFYPARGGEISLYGNFYADGKTRIAQAVVSVKAAATGRKPASLLVTPLGPTTIATGGSSAIQAMVTYDDKTSVDVTKRCSWSSSNPSLAQVFDGRVQVMGGTGEVTVTCAFSENGVTVADGQAYTVVLDQSLIPTGRPSGGQYYQMY